MEIEIGKTYLVKITDGLCGEYDAPTQVVAKTASGIYIGIRDWGWTITKNLASQFNIPQKYIGKNAWFFIKNDSIDSINK